MRPWILLVIAILCFSGCERSAPAEQTQRAEGGITKSAEMPEAPERIVSLAPNVTEMLFALGAGEQVVAVSRFCDWPPEVEGLPKTGGFLDPDHEAILAQKPDLVLGVQGGADHQVLRVVQSAGIAYGFVEIDDTESVEAAMRTLGGWVGREAQADELAERFRRELDEASAQVQKTLEGQVFRALIVFDHEPIVAAGPDTFGAELLSLAGLENVLGQGVSSYPVLDMEKVLSLNPEVILDVSIGPTTEEVQRFWGRFSSLPAVKEGRVVHIADPVMMRPGPRLPEALHRLGAAVEGL